MAFDPESRPWQATVLLVGVGLAVVPALLSLNVYTPREAATFGAILLWIFLLAYGANRLQRWLARPPISPWKATFLGTVLFLPMFLGTYPFASTLQALSAAHGFEGTPSPVWPFVVLFWGLFAPVGILAEGLRRFRADLNGSGREADPDPSR